MKQRLKLASYGVCIRSGHILLARYIPPDGGAAYWTLPGGKVEHGEDPVDTVVREVAEETGYVVEVQQMLGVGSRTHEVDWGIAGGALLHNIGLFYMVRVLSGTLRPETEGSTDLAEWVQVDVLANSARAVIVDLGIDLERRRPPDGRGTVIIPGGLLHP